MLQTYQAIYENKKLKFINETPKLKKAKVIVTIITEDVECIESAESDEKKVKLSDCLLAGPTLKNDEIKNIKKAWVKNS